MRKFLALGTFFLLPILTLSAGQYVGIHGGSDYPYHTDASRSGQKVGYHVGGTYGYDWGNQIRTELEVSYREAHKRTKYVVKDEQEESRDHQSTHSLSYMANVCYDISQLQVYNVTPYVGAGIGYAQNTDKSKLQKETTTNEMREHDDRFAWQILAGASYPIADKTSVSARYAFHVGHEHQKNHSFGIALIRSF